MESPADHSGIAAVKQPSAWVIGCSALPFGVVTAYASTVLAYVLSHEGVPIDRIALISSVVSLPTVFGFLLKPLLDTGWSRQVYSWLLVSLAALLGGLGAAMLSPAHLVAAQWMFFAAVLACVLYGGASNGWIARFTRESERGAVGAWNSTFNLAGGAVLAFVMMAIVTRWKVPLVFLGLGLGVSTMLAAAPLLFYPRAAPPEFRFSQVMNDTLRTVWRTIRTRNCLIAFALFIAPAGAGAAGGLQSGFGQDFHASDAAVVWVTGLGSAAASFAGALCGGRLASRFPDSRAYLYLLCAAATGLISIATAVFPHSQAIFIWSTIFYNVTFGAQLAVYYALAMELVGQSAVATTQLGLFAASQYFSITYMTLADGSGYKHGGIRGLFLVDGIATLVSTLLLTIFIHFVSQRADPFDPEVVLS